MQPPTALSDALREFDRGLRVRWSDAVGRFCIERRHGYAGLGTDAVLQMLYDKWKRLEHDGLGHDNVDLAREERLAYDEFDSRRQGYQPILYLWPSETNHPEAIILILLNMDIRRAGGPYAWAQRTKDAQERATKVLRMQRRERLRDMAERAFDKVACKKDFHGSGGDAFFYQHDKIEPKE